VRSTGPVATLTEVVPTMSTTVRDANGQALGWSHDSAGLQVILPAAVNGDPVIVVLGHVDASGAL
jgi:hypothetical protein